MKIVVLGGDGYLGWPTSLHLAAQGHEVCAVDNYLKRGICQRLSLPSLLPWEKLPDRTALWRNIGGADIDVRIGDVTDYAFVAELFESQRPDAVVHFAEQPSAPYSMMSREAAALTLTNNLTGTLNIAYAVREKAPGCHIVKLGTMGEYGTPNIDIEEGWLDIEHKGRAERFLFPRQASSLYHTTKIQDTDLLWFYVRTWGLRVTDLMQGPVYGIATGETERDERLFPSFHYDELFGTVINRFIAQAVCGHPLTVYGSGGQIRGYLNLRDTVACIRLALEHPPGEGQLRIFNQVTETFSVNELAGRVKRVGEGLGYAVEVAHRENPRVEKEEHYYNPRYTGLAELGLEPHLLTDEALEEMFRIVGRYRDAIDSSVIVRGVRWK